LLSRAAVRPPPRPTDRDGWGTRFLSPLQFHGSGRMVRPRLWVWSRAGRSVEAGPNGKG
jgi:hypothetical protein